jgi:hypothetical protein
MELILDVLMRRFRIFVSKETLFLQNERNFPHRSVPTARDWTSGRLIVLRIKRNDNQLTQFSSALT